MLFAFHAGNDLLTFSGFFFKPEFNPIIVIEFHKQNKVSLFSIATNVAKPFQFAKNRDGLLTE